MRKTICLLVGLLALAVMQSAPAAKRLGPPIEDLQSTPDRIRIVIAQAGEKTGKYRIRFAVADRLTGEAPDEVVLRTDEQTYSDVEPGQDYIVAWTYQRRNRGVIGDYEEDPLGPSTVSVLGLGSTALFEDTPEMRYLFAPGTMTDPDHSARKIDALLAQMKRPDPRSRGLVITELWLRPDLTGQMTSAQVAVLKDIAQTEELAPQQRDYLLQAAYQLPAKQTAPWLGEELRKVIIQNGTQYDLKTFIPSLVITAAEGLQQAGAASDIELLSILLYSNNPGVSKAALATIDHFDPQAAKAKAEQAIARGWIHSETRYALDRYLRSTGS